MKTLLLPLQPCLLGGPSAIEFGGFEDKESAHDFSFMEQWLCRRSQHHQWNQHITPHVTSKTTSLLRQFSIFLFLDRKRHPRKPIKNAERWPLNLYDTVEEMGSDLSKGAVVGIIIGAASLLLLTYLCCLWMPRYLAYRREERDYRDIDDFEGMLYVGDAIRKSRGQQRRWRPASLRSNASMWIGRNRKVELFHSSRKKPDWLQHPIVQMDDLERISPRESPLQVPGTTHLRSVTVAYNGLGGPQASALSEGVVGPWPMPTRSVEPPASSATDLNKPLPLLPPDGVRRYRRMTPRTAKNTNQHIRAEDFGRSIQERRRRSPLLKIFVPPPSAINDLVPGAETCSDPSGSASANPAIPLPLTPRTNPWRLFPSPPPTRTWAMRRILGEEEEYTSKER